MTNDIEYLFVGLLVIFMSFFCGVSTHIFFLAQFLLGIVLLLSCTQLHFHALEKEMATHSSVLAWRIPGTGKPGGLPSMGSHRVRHDRSDLAAGIF